MDNPRTTLCLSGPFKSFMATPGPRSSLSREHPRTLTLPAPSRQGPLRDSTEDRRIGLNMNYSIIFTEISYSVTNNPNNSYDYSRLFQNPTEKWRAVCQFWLQGGKHNVTLTDKNSSDESHLGDLLTPPFFGEGRRLQGSPKKQPKCNT